ncbi:anthranilate synthase component I family protein [Aquiluna sp.]|nr:anthranilate synthase component I family protein [Aquiluna sp.]MDB4254414.1 anthranilate synthase component I family protein [Aquiluna sp.]
MTLYYERIAGWSPIADTFTSFFSSLPNCFWLDREHHHDSRFSIIGTGHPTSSLAPKPSVESFQDLPFAFRPGFVGVVEYSSPGEGPLVVAGINVDRAFVFDHDKRAMFFIGEFANQKLFLEWFHAALLRLAIAGGDAAVYDFNNDAATAVELTAVDSKSDYLNNINIALAEISKGEIYQICLTTELRGEFTGDPLALFLRLRRQHHAPYCTYLKVDGVEYLSISPERFLTVSGSRVLSSPIKGTRARSEDPEMDRALMDSLVSDEKERAENLMIVDLIRNDLSSVCKAESITVEALLAIRSYSTVHQLVSDVSGELQQGMTGLEALTALFPGGSMTGAPKIRACELIAQIENRQRGAYSGAIGWISGSGDMDLGMVIRTAVFSGSSVTIAIGGGITSGSEPEAEHEEIKLKALALVEAMSASVNW